MRALAFVGVILLWVACGSAARGDQSVSLAWDASPDSNVIGYFLYYGNASGDCPKLLNITNSSQTNVTVIGLKEGAKYTFVVTAYDSDGLESEPSAEVSYTVPGAFLTINRLSNPNKLRIIFGVTTTNHFVLALEASEDLQSWTNLLNLNITSHTPGSFYDQDVNSSPHRFFRTVFQVPCDP